MVSIILNIFSKLLRWVICLVITGELVSCAMHMKQGTFKTIKIIVWGGCVYARFGAKWPRLSRGHFFKKKN